ncbi:MAG: 3-phosphoglycerate dehydrogenase family protein [Christensenellales bacterium]|jgi:D-3-phosphoglycerate dehydrogenase
MYYRVKTMNAISDIIHKELTPDYYQVGPDVEDAHALLVRSHNCMDVGFSKNLMAIARAGAGYNNIPVDRCTKAGIVVFNTPGANANAVKELVLGLMLASARNVIPGTQWVQALKGKENISKLVEKGKSQFVGPELRGKKLAVVGLGAIGVMVANAGHAINMDVHGYDPFLSVEAAWGVSRAIHRAKKLEDILPQCDYVTIHVPANEKTRGMFNAQVISGMKDGATLINFARNEIVDTAAVIDAVNTGKLQRYITDFPTEELLGNENILCVPHLGASTPESEENCAQMAAHQLYEYLEYGNITNSVNFPYCNLQHSGRFRLAIIHQNLPTMVSQITAAVAHRNANISDMINKSRGEIAYTILDLDEPLNEETISRLYGIGGIIRIRVIDAMR